MNPRRLELKCPSGWFAAGREVRLAATLLSDSTFKLFVWACLHAERNSGRLRLNVADLARSLQKTEREIDGCIHELVNAGICRFHAPDSLEMQERFWPYRRHLPETRTDELEAYVGAVRRLFLGHGCVASSFSAADERVAADWRRRGVSLERAERAICLGVARKYAALVNNAKGSPITALSYFEGLLEEANDMDVSPNYWQYVRDRTKQFERTWRNGKAAGHPLSTPTEETK
jgi:hypothetical protein